MGQEKLGQKYVRSFEELCGAETHEIRTPSIFTIGAHELPCREVVTADRNTLLIKADEPRG